MPAFEDAVRDFGPDHLLIALRRADRAAWPEQRLLEGLLARYDLPLTVFTSGDRRGRRTAWRCVARARVCLDPGATATR